MRLSLRVFFIVFFFFVISVASKAEITLKDLIFDDSKPYHIKILETLPKNAIIQVGPDNAKHTVIEFFDYFCGYCKKIHPELINLATAGLSVPCCIYRKHMKRRMLWLRSKTLGLEG